MMDSGESSGISWTICKHICTSIPTDNYTNTPSVNFYRLDALPDAQPTVSALKACDADQWAAAACWFRTDEKNVFILIKFLPLFYFINIFIIHKR